MKKLIIGLLFLFTSLTAVADSWYLLPYINIKPEGGNWIGWIKVEPEPIKMHFEPEKKKITIYSNTIQYIDYSALFEDNYSGYTTLTGYAKDGDYKTLILQIASYENGSEFLSLSYKDGEYMYLVEKIIK